MNPMIMRFLVLAALALAVASMQMRARASGPGLHVGSMVAPTAGVVRLA